MSLYNLLHGVNPISPLLLKILDIDQDNKKWSSGRFRDIYLDEKGEKIILYTRNGGGNRECWGEVQNNCLCAGCVIEKHLPKHPNYLRDYDDDFDSTYAYIEFSIPESYKELVKSFATGEKPETIKEKFDRTIKSLETKTAEELKNDPKLKPIMKIFEKIEKDESGIIEI
ncbi:MAG: hypothetical protein AABY22_21260 [Nanoarchaeota archaeon]